MLGRAGSARLGPRWAENEKKNKKKFSYYFPETILNAYFDEFE